MSKDWWRSAVIYQVYPRSFQDGNGDGIGDLQGIAKRLDHIASLGADAVWLSPIFTSPMADMGYDVSDYRDIDPLFGDLADFDRLVARCHELGLKVVIDQVLSHSSDKHAWFSESRQSRDNPRADWYVWADPQADGSPPNNWPSVFGGSAWEWEPRRKQYYLHNFLREQPDLNLHNPEVQDALLDVMQFWLDRGVDGFRLDTVNFYFHDRELRNNPPADRDDRNEIADTYSRQDHVYSKNRPDNIAFLKRMRALTDQYEDRMMVGEVGEGGETATRLMAEYTGGNDRLHLCYSFELLSPEFSAEHFRQVLGRFRKATADGTACWSFSNHDVPRHVSRWAEHGRTKESVARQAIAMLMSFEGAIGIYQGEELGQEESVLTYDELTDPPGLRFWPEIKGRDGCRTPMVWNADQPFGGFSEVEPWLPVKQPQLARATDVSEADTTSVLHTYRDVISFRKSSQALTNGVTEFLETPEPILAFSRKAADQNLTCIFNLSPETANVQLTAPARLTGPVQADLQDNVLTLGPNGFAFLDTGNQEVLPVKG